MTIRRFVPMAWPLLAVPLLAVPFTVRSAAPAGPRFTVRTAPGLASAPLDGRLLLLVSKDESQEPRFQIEDGPKSQQAFGIDVDGWAPGTAATFEAGVLGYPLEHLRDLPAGTYTVQALLHKYETFHRSDGHTVKLPMDRGEGQQWNRAPGNLYSTPRKVTIDPAAAAPVEIVLDKTIPPIPEAPATKYVRHERIQSERLTKFWGRPMYLGAHILVPEGFDTHPDARYPLVINHGHFPQTIDGFREQPPDPNLKPDYSDRFHWAGYNRTQEEWAYQLYKDWTSPTYPRMLVVEIQHANPYYDDSYAVNSANLGPYGDAITYELIPYLEKKYRALGGGWARFMYGGSTGGWEAMAAQMFYPDEYNGAWCACPDPIDFRAFTVVDIYKDKNAYWTEGPFLRVPRPGKRDYLGHVSVTIEQINRLEQVLGDKSRSGQQWDIWEAVYSPAGADGYPQRIWDKRTGAIDPKVAAYWQENYDLGYILRRDWDKGLGKKLEGKLSIYVGDMDNYYLNNAVYLAEDFLKQTKNPSYEGLVDYGDRAEHCWNGDHT
ncbi:MAG TPA: alpha/beta hydrolase-fold protein, partial [Vicinamibacteria bacterium]|nr:alpha/beta hydrolase-fold protein [Vicinamibacteria bacterium]